MKKVLGEVQDEFIHMIRTNQPQRGYAYALQVHVLAIGCPRRCRLSVRHTQCLRVHVTNDLLGLHLENSMLSSCNFPVNKQLQHSFDAALGLFLGLRSLWQNGIQPERDLYVEATAA